MLQEFPYTTKQQIFLKQKSSYDPLPAVFRVRLFHEQEYLVSNIFETTLFAKSVLCPRGVPVPADVLEPLPDYWSFPGGMKALHALYKNSWVESAKIHWTISSAKQFSPFEATFFVTTPFDIQDYINGFGAPSIDVPDEKYDSFRSLPSSKTLAASIQSGGHSIVKYSQSFDLSSLNPQYTMDTKYSTESSLIGSMLLRSLTSPDFLKTPCFAVCVKAQSGQVGTHDLRISYKVEFNMRFANMHPLDTVNPLVPEPEPP